MSEEKLRGGFYSPDVLVDMCIKRAATLLGDRRDLRVLEPAAGDGAFLRGLERSELGSAVQHIEAVEIFEEEAQKAARALFSLNLPGNVRHDSILQWAQTQDSDYDLVLANPPYVRFQFISEEDKHRAKAISAELGVTGSSVSNLWIPVLLLSLSKLRDGGAFSIILPTEFLTGISAKAVRNWLLAQATDLSLDLFKPGSFPSVLQEVLVLSGRISKNSTTTQVVQFYDHNGGTRSWSHTISAGTGTWTNYLLSPTQHGALDAVRSISEVKPLANVARFSVSTVTGANDYFCLSSDELDMYDLSDWALPLLSRSRYAQGLTFNKYEQRVLAESGHKAWMVSFSADKPSPEHSPRALQYLKSGEQQAIHTRFKCRVREPWYRVPVVPAGDLLLSKRSNHYPRVISNHASVVTTDTIYKGRILPGASITADDFTATFHNSLTMLSAEVEGRSFGGGVLELVPSEVNALQIPVVPGASKELSYLDKISRTSPDPESLISATDETLTRLIPALEPEMMSALSEARNALMDRRLQRTHSKFYG